MAGKHPYISGSGGIVQATAQFRKSFPTQITADTLKKLGIASNNETFVINILRFIRVLDDEGKTTSSARSIFTEHNDEEFQVGFAGLVKTAYGDLFSLHGDSAWNLSTDKLISYFRNSDQSGAIVGQRQASTFRALAGLSGHGEVPANKTVAIARVSAKKSIAKKAVKEQKKDIDISKSVDTSRQKGGKDLGLTVRIEINLPTAADQDTYDRIFRSIRENLLNGE